MSREVCYYHFTDNFNSIIYTDGNYSIINNDFEKDSNFIYSNDTINTSTLDPNKYICEKTDHSGIYYINKSYIEKTKDINKKEYNSIFVKPEDKFDKNGNCISGDYIPRAKFHIEENGSYSLVIPKENNTATKYIFSCH